MSNFREAQRQAHPTKTNTLLLGVMCVLILILVMQVWLLTAALNESLDGHNAVKWPAFWVSLALFGSGAALLRYLPSPLRVPVHEVVREAFRREQGSREISGLVGQAREPHAAVLQGEHAVHDTAIDARMQAVLAQVVALVRLPCRIEKRRRCVDAREHGRDQVLGPAPDQRLDFIRGDGFERKLAQHRVQRDFEIAKGVDERAVQVEDGGVD